MKKKKEKKKEFLKKKKEFSLLNVRESTLCGMVCFFCY